MAGVAKVHIFAFALPLVAFFAVGFPSSFGGFISASEA
jgi:hypothetical protein